VCSDAWETPARRVSVTNRSSKKPPSVVFHRPNMISDHSLIISSVDITSDPDPLKVTQYVRRRRSATFNRTSFVNDLKQTALVFDASTDSLRPLWQRFLVASDTHNWFLEHSFKGLTLAHWITNHGWFLFPLLVINLLKFVNTCILFQCICTRLDVLSVELSVFTSSTQSSALFYCYALC